MQNSSTVTGGSAVVETLNGGLTFGAANQQLNVTGASGYGLKIAGVPTLNAGSTATFDVASGLSLELAGAIAANSGNLTKQDSGLMILSGANAQTGIVTLSAGILRGTQTASFGANTTATGLSLNGGTLELRANAALTPTNKNVTVGGNTTIAVDVTSGLTGYLTGTTPLEAAPSLVDVLGTLSIGNNSLNFNTASGSPSTAAGLTFGATTLTGASGAISTFTVGSGDQLTLGAFATSPGGFDKEGSGLLILGTNATGNIAASTVGAGILRLNAATAPDMASGGISVIGATVEVGNITYAGSQITLNNNATLLGVLGNASNYGVAGGVNIASALRSVLAPARISSATSPAARRAPPTSLPSAAQLPWRAARPGPP